ncbi:hypothetical protein ES705_49267 [subsurface metagenome]
MTVGHCEKVQKFVICIIVMTSERSDYCRRNDDEKNTGTTALIPHRDKVP